MSNRSLNLPEPVLPEHTLIRESAPVPELSAGFKSKVMSNCKTSIAHANKVWRWKVAGCVTSVCCLALLAFLTIPDTPDSAPTMTSQPVLETHPSSLGFSSPGGGVAVDVPKPSSTRDAERSQMDQLIEKLNKRPQMFNADMLPQF